MQNLPLVLAVTICFLLPVLGTGASDSLKQAPESKRTVVFAVFPAEKGKKPDHPLVDPIAFLNRGHLEKLPEYNYDKQTESDAVYKSFEQQYYKHGLQYPLLIHGSVQGNLTVEEPTSMSCVDQVATVKLSAPLPEDHMRIAVTSLAGLGAHSDRDGVVADEDRSNFLNVAAAYLKHRGVMPAPKIKIDYLYSVSLTSDAANELVGSITARQKSVIRHLFLLATKTDQGYIAGLTSYHVTKDVVDHTDDVSEEFVEHMDLDNDGSDEIITMMHYYESWNYNVYRKTNGAWKVIYNGGGGGC
jgi:hypothetical protein